MGLIRLFGWTGILSAMNPSGTVFGGPNNDGQQTKIIFYALPREPRPEDFRPQRPPQTQRPSAAPGGGYRDYVSQLVDRWQRQVY